MSHAFCKLSYHKTNLKYLKGSIAVRRKSFYLDCHREDGPQLMMRKSTKPSKPEENLFSF